MAFERWRWFGFALAVVCVQTPAIAQTRPAVTHMANPTATRFMWVGNSFFYYNDGMQDIVLHLLEGMPGGQPRPFFSTLFAISGASIMWHDVAAYFLLDGIGSRKRLAAEHVDKLWDASMIMDCSDCPIKPQTRPDFVAEIARDVVIMRRFGAEPVLFMTWAYSDHPEMTAPVADAYTNAGNANNALVVPAGLAFARVAAERPDLVLTLPDHRHPTLLGSYLAASTVFSALFSRSPEPSSFADGLDPATAAYLRNAAWRTATTYYGTNP